MKRRTRSILEEINLFPQQDQEKVIEARAKNIIESAINLMDLIDESYSEDTAKDLRSRFLNSIRGADAKKFSRGIKKVLESK